MRTINEIIANYDYLRCIESEFLFRLVLLVYCSVRMLYWRFFLLARRWMPAGFWSTHCELFSPSWSYERAISVLRLLFVIIVVLVVGVDIMVINKYEKTHKSLQCFSTLIIGTVYVCGHMCQRQLCAAALNCRFFFSICMRIAVRTPLDRARTRNGETMWS